MPDSLKRIATEITSCTNCSLYKNACNGVPGDGSPNARVFFIGQAPGAQEDAIGRPFVGRAGQYLVSMLESIGLTREEVFITSTVKHFQPKNRAPTALEITACRPYLVRQLELVKPSVVVLLGKTAQSLIGHLILSGKTVLVTVHPSAAMRFPLMAKRMNADFAKLKKLIR